MNRIFSRRRDRMLVYQTMREGKLDSSRRIKCPECGAESAGLEWERALQVCPRCGFHAPIDAYYRLSGILDPGSFQELEEVSPADPLAFPDYPAKLARLEVETGLRDGAVTALGRIEGRRAVFGVMDSRFLMGSMGTAVGERITQAAEYAARKKLPLVIFSASGGARMQEGIFSLMLHPPHHRRGDSQLCFTGGHHAGRAGGPHRLCRAEGHRADHQGTAARGFPARRISAGPRLFGPDRPPERVADGAGPAAGPP